MLFKSGYSKKTRKCKTPLYNNHFGNTHTFIRYAMHCKTKKILDDTVSVFKKLGFHVKQENDNFHHTFITPPISICPSGIFTLNLIVKDDGCEEKLQPGIVQGPHLAFLVKNPKIYKKIVNISCNIVKTTLINKPDENSCFIELPCKKVIEFSGRKKNFKYTLKK